MYHISGTVEYESFPDVSELWELLSVTHPNYYGSDVIDGYSGLKIPFENYGNYLEKKYE